MEQTNVGAERFQASNQAGTRADATMAKALHECFQHSFPTSWHCGRHICWTWYCLDRLRMKRFNEEIQQSLFENSKRGPFKSEPSMFNTLTENASTRKDWKTCHYNHRIDASTAGQQQPVFWSPCRERTRDFKKKKNEKVTVERKKKDSEKATLLVLLDLSLFLPLNRGGFYIVFLSLQISKFAVHPTVFLSSDPLLLSKGCVANSVLLIAGI